MNTIHNFSASLIQRTKQAGRYSTSGIYTSTVNSFFRFIGHRSITFADLTPSLIKQYEDRLLGESEYALDDQMPMQLNEMEIFSRHKDETLKDLEACMEIRSFSVGEVVYGQGSIGDELYWVRRGAVRLMANLAEGQQKPVASFGRGDFFGGLAFMDNQPRPNDAIAYAPTEVYVLSREKFTLIADGHKKLAFNLSNAIARTLAMRLRRTERKLTMLQEY